MLALPPRLVATDLRGTEALNVRLTEYRRPLRGNGHKAVLCLVKSVSPAYPVQGLFTTENPRKKIGLSVGSGHHVEACADEMRTNLVVFESDEGLRDS